MNSYHQALNDAKVVIDDLGQRCQAVGCAGSIAMEKETTSVKFYFIFLFVVFKIYSSICDFGSKNSFISKYTKKILT